MNIKLQKNTFFNMHFIWSIALKVKLQHKILVESIRKLLEKIRGRGLEIFLSFNAIESRSIRNGA